MGPHCGTEFRGSYVSHMGQKHNEVVKYLPPEAVKLCPIELQGKSHNRRGRRAAIVIKRRYFGGFMIWPELPEGYDPAGDGRELVEELLDDLEEKSNSEQKEFFSTVVEDMEIVYEIEEDEPIVVKKEGKEDLTDYTGVRGSCFVCKEEFEVPEAVLHLHQVHEIEGGSSHIMSDAQSLIDGGFIKLLLGDCNSAPVPNPGDRDHPKVNTGVKPSTKDSDNSLVENPCHETPSPTPTPTSKQKARKSTTPRESQLQPWFSDSAVKQTVTKSNTTARKSTKPQSNGVGQSSTKSPVPNRPGDKSVSPISSETRKMLLLTSIKNAVRRSMDDQGLQESDKSALFTSVTVRNVEEIDIV